MDFQNTNFIEFILEVTRFDCLQKNERAGCPFCHRVHKMLKRVTIRLRIYIPTPVGSLKQTQLGRIINLMLAPSIFP